MKGDDKMERHIIKAILKAIKDGVVPKKEDFNMEKEEWGNYFGFIKGEDLAQGITVVYGGPGNKPQHVFLSGLRITDKGLTYLEN
jgi:hypothetical protein